ncbi:hypothetical protein [Burkholderia gladioli]|uniref:hypothetical protein n=1 Tax=Burkholderia gladioli TaxID=28095 RepID=UPI0016401329|nr:hypothetical protein [Burkholderia gladioli]
MFKTIIRKLRGAQAAAPAPTVQPSDGKDPLDLAASTIDPTTLVQVRKHLEAMRSNIESTRARDPAFAAIVEDACTQVAASIDAAFAAKAKADALR